ncbi:PREDICTED: shootin-1-like [Nanorana parkeri]|uniref:shootin-1-like n=1 Tax=Nanorana parkeri TaxID=125878 RepID=UPI0008543D77|nr:PREDICTED: shootin-1-like [Nanorana parkeri]
MLDTINPSTNRRRPGTISPASTETELQRILRRRKVTTDKDASTGPLSSTESKSMPVLGSETTSPVTQKARNAESGTQRGHPTAETPDADKPLHVTSHYCEALSCVQADARFGHPRRW